MGQILGLGFIFCFLPQYLDNDYYFISFLLSLPRLLLLGYQIYSRGDSLYPEYVYEFLYKHI